MKVYSIVAKLTALLTFLLGTVIFLLFYFLDASSFLFVGFLYIIFAVIINLIVLIYVIVKVKKDTSNKSSAYKSYAIMFLNIPAAFLYCSFSIIILNTMRITLNNTTDTNLTNIIIDGCEKKLIGGLDKGESKTIWISINNDCSVQIQYLLNGKEMRASVIDYTTIMNGHKMTYDIVSYNK
ncbi:MAG: hypothetical protein ACK5KT_04545 [Dysgonomonas sp.]